MIATENVTLAPHHCTHHQERRPGDYVVLAVSDDGVGMDQETHKRIFEPFFTTKAVGRGTGLGLATVYGIVKQSDGFIEVISEVGEGTTFRIYIPRHHGANETVSERNACEPLRGNECVLMVDDDPRILQISKEMLLSIGYSVLAANGPETALEQAKVHGKNIDLVVTDIIMPKMSGRELFVWLKPLCPKLKCLFVSGYTADTISSQSTLETGVHFLQKPFSLTSLATKIREALMPEDSTSKESSTFTQCQVTNVLESCVQASEGYVKETRNVFS